MMLSGAAAVVIQPAIVDARRTQCRYNMITISNLMRVHRIKDPNHAFATNLGELKGDTPYAPKCPDGGTYTIRISNGTLIGQSGHTVPAGQPVISCSSRLHGKYAMDIDIN